MYRAELDTPLGKLHIESDGRWITRCRFRHPGRAQHARQPRLLQDALFQLDAYFHGRRQRFDLPLQVVGTPYRRAVRSALLAIPFGTTRSFGGVALIAGGNARSVAAAAAVNPLLVLIPCHRILSAQGLMTGYPDGLWRKQGLLELEGVLPG